MPRLRRKREREASLAPMISSSYFLCEDSCFSFWILLRALYHFVVARGEQKPKSWRVEASDVYGQRPISASRNFPKGLFCGRARFDEGSRNFCATLGESEITNR